MYIDGDRLNISRDLTLDDVVELKKFVEGRLDYIEEIGFEEEEGAFVTAALFQFLASLKKTKPQIRIDLLDAPYEVERMGTQYWMLQDG